MADGSKIEWTDATVNFWWGCTKVGPGCDHCYAETWAKRTGGPGLWGVGAPRRKIKSARALIHRLDNDYSEWAADAICRRENAKAFGLPIPVVGNRRRVFIQSMSDIFDLEVPIEWFDEAWELIHVCDRLEIQIVTKRVSAVRKRIEAGGGRKTWPAHAGLIITVVSQDEADRDIPRLLALREEFGIPWIGLSCEPLLGPIVLAAEFLALGKRAWTIVGGESGPNARPMHPAWARSIRDQCQAAGVAYFFKQWGAWASAAVRISTGEMVFRQFDTFDHWVNKASTWVNGGICLDAAGNRLRIGADFMAARDEGRFPVTIMHNVGKAAAGRLLDGRTWDEFPEARRPTG